MFRAQRSLPPRLVITYNYMFSRRRSLNGAAPSPPSSSSPTALLRLFRRTTLPATNTPPPSFLIPSSMAQVQSAPIQTTNNLGSKDRFNLIRRTRKLEQVFGVSMLVMDSQQEAPEPQSRSAALESEPETVAAPLRRRLKSLRRSASTTAVPSASTKVVKTSSLSDEGERVDPPSRSSSKPSKTLVYAKSIPNHNVPVLQLVSSPAKPLPAGVERLTVPAGRHRSSSTASTATTDSVDSALTVISPTLKAHRHRQFQNAKLHRRLGETIPANLLGPSSSTLDLPPIARQHRRIVSDDASVRSASRFDGNEEEVALLKERRSLEQERTTTSAPAVPTKSENLTPQEKNLHVRRAQKMASVSALECHLQIRYLQTGLPTSEIRRSSTTSSVGDHQCSLKVQWR